LDVTEKPLLPVTEWFPATSRFIRSSLSKIRRRSPSPHLGLDSVEVEVNSFEDEKLVAMQRMRLADLEASRTDLISCHLENEGEFDMNALFGATNEINERRNVLESALKSVSYLNNCVSGCKDLLGQVAALLVDPEQSDELQSVRDSIDSRLDALDDNVVYPLNVQLDDIYSLTRGMNERIVSLKTYDAALSERQVSCSDLARLQSDAIKAMDRAQGSLSTLTASSASFDRKIAAKNAEIEKRIQRVEETGKDFHLLDRNVCEQLERWEVISDEFLMEKLKGITCEVSLK
jgi:CHASE3 domain sensor protein